MGIIDLSGQTTQGKISDLLMVGAWIGVGQEWRARARTRLRVSGRLGFGEESECSGVCSRKIEFYSK